MTEEEKKIKVLEWLGYHVKEHEVFGLAYCEKQDSDTWLGLVVGYNPQSDEEATLKE